MNDAPETIWAKPNYDEWSIGGWDTHGKAGGTPYRRADLPSEIDALRSRVATLEAELPRAWEKGRHAAWWKAFSVRAGERTLKAIAALPTPTLAQLEGEE